MNYNSSLQLNNAELQALIDIANALPEASGGVELPELSNSASTAEVFNGYEYIDENGEKKIGAFTIESELNEQDNLIAQLQSMVDSLPKAGGVELPMLDNPATSDEILEGYEAIDGDGNIVVGTHTCSGGNEIISIMVKTYSNEPIFYLDASSQIRCGYPGDNIQALHGIVMYYGAYTLAGEGVENIASSYGSHRVVKFNSSGGSVYVSDQIGNGGGAEA